ncbi:hypothetical protein A3Q56_05035 [Intoshia linei]|uniref:Uncharacterized protein n=1 Tax=Intoshia linei TaxID=1819745 RepID=A0A177B0G5_9BILA|nr:hypothetical protein A3Q56_05035 [Intoshia linei]
MRYYFSTYYKIPPIILFLPNSIENIFNIDENCFEKQFFYRLMSGLHSSINIAIISTWINVKNTDNPLLNKVKSKPNLLEFKKKFDPEFTKGEGPGRLLNLYFLYMVQIRSIQLLLPHLKMKKIYSGDENEDAKVRGNLKKLGIIINEFDAHYNEKMFFVKERDRKMLFEYEKKFHNITKIMDCLGCANCKLWGKLQMFGLGSTLNLIFSNANNFDALKQTIDYFSRRHIVALFNSLARTSDNISKIKVFKHLYDSKLEL